MNKLCKKCKSEKEIKEFNHDIRNNDGHDSYCTICRNEYSKENYQKNKKKKAKQYKDNIIEIKKRRKEFSKNNPEKIKKQNKNSYEKNKEGRIKAQKEYYKVNKKEINKYSVEYMREYRRDKILTDEFYKFKCSIRDLIKGSIRNKNFTKSSKTSDILGCSYQKFKQYIENKWESWMNWENYGNWNGISTNINQSWDLDHIVPLCTAGDEKEFIKLNHYTNFQPLCSYKNRFIKKGKI